MKKSLLHLAGVWAVLCMLVACGDDNEAYDPYANWQARNAEYFSQVASQARSAIAQAKAAYGDSWEEHCEWRMFKSYHKPQGVAGALTDSICVHIEHKGEGRGCPMYSDSVRVNYRGTLMSTQYMENGELKTKELVFSQSFTGEPDLPVLEATAAPALMGVSSAVYGFATALQYMHVGDAWRVYMPSELGYGATASGAIPAFSTLTFYIHLVDYYLPGTGVPGWQ